MGDIERDFVHLARLALEGKSEDVAALVRRTLRVLAERRPDLSGSVRAVLMLAAASSVARAISVQPLPVDVDSRLELLRREITPALVIEPTWPPEVAGELEAVLQEHLLETELRDAGLSPTRSLLFVGPPGVGKTLAARWLAVRCGRPLLTLDLAAVMSSFLGRTGNNIRIVLDYARRAPSVLLLDEFDAIAKRRDDAVEVGELKRLVTVLLQAIDEWPSDGLLVAATNHPELLDPAVWRRFERVVRFPQPTSGNIRSAITRLLEPDETKASVPQVDTLAALLVGQSFADVARHVTAARRGALIRRISLSAALEELASDLVRRAPLDQKLQLAKELDRLGRSQRSIATLTGLARDTIRKHLGSPQRRRSTVSEAKS